MAHWLSRPEWPPNMMVEVQNARKPRFRGSPVLRDVKKG